MPANQPYDPRYNAKIYVPKLTEEQRRARATPLENLKGLRYRTEVPDAKPVTAHVAPQSPPQPKAAVPSPTQDAPRYVPTAREIVIAEFPEIYPERRVQTHSEMPTDDQGVRVGAGYQPRNSRDAAPRKSWTTVTMLPQSNSSQLHSENGQIRGPSKAPRPQCTPPPRPARQQVLPVKPGRPRLSLWV